MLCDLLKADIKSLLFFFLILQRLIFVLRSRDPDHRFKGLYNLIVLNILWPRIHMSEFDAAGCFYDNILPFLHRQIFRIKIVDLSGTPKSDADHLCHNQFSFI